MKEHYFDTDRHQLPKSWDDLADEQVGLLASVLHSQVMSETLDTDILRILMPENGIWFITESDMVSALAFISATRRIKALQPIKVGLRKLYGPSDRLSNISFGEFITAESYFNAFYESKDERKLDRLCATLFRPSKWPWQKVAGDIRTKFDSNDVEPNAKDWAKVALPEKLAVAVYFAGCKESMAKSFPKVFKKSVNSKAVQDKAVWLKSLHSLADGLPNYDAVLDTRLNLVFFEMTQLIETNERLKAEMEASKRR